MAVVAGQLVFPEVLHQPAVVRVQRLLETARMQRLVPILLAAKLGSHLLLRLPGRLAAVAELAVDVVAAAEIYNISSDKGMVRNTWQNAENVCFLFDDDMFCNLQMQKTEGHWEEDKWDAAR